MVRFFGNPLDDIGGSEDYFYAGLPTLMISLWSRTADEAKRAGTLLMENFDSGPCPLFFIRRPPFNRGPSHGDRPSVELILDQERNNMD
jgi:hypothetical protein